MTQGDYENAAQAYDAALRVGGLPVRFHWYQFGMYEAFYNVVILATVPAELAFALWLLIKGVNVAQWENRALAVEAA